MMCVCGIANTGSSMRKRRKTANLEEVEESGQEDVKEEWDTDPRQGRGLGRGTL